MPIIACSIKQGLHKIVRESLGVCRVSDKKCADTAASYRRLVAMLDGFPGCLSTGPFGAAGDVLFIGSTGSAAPLMEYCESHGAAVQPFKAGSKQHPLTDGDLHEQARCAFSEGVMAHLNTLGWTDCGPMLDGASKTGRLLIHGIKPYSTIAVTPEDPVDADHPSVIASFQFKSDEISVDFSPSISRLTPVQFYSLCPSERDWEVFEAGDVVDLTGRHEGHAINAAARCTMLEGMEPSLILAVSRGSPHDFLNAIMQQREDHEEIDPLPAFDDTLDRLTRQYMRQPEGREGADNEGARGAVDSCRVFYILRLGLTGPDCEDNEASPSRFAVVPSTHVCGVHTFLRAKAGRDSAGVSALFHADFTASMAILAPRESCTPLSSLITTSIDEVRETGLRTYSFSPLNPPSRAPPGREEVCAMLDNSLARIPITAASPAKDSPLQPQRVKLSFGGKPPAHTQQPATPQANLPPKKATARGFPIGAVLDSGGTGAGAGGGGEGGGAEPATKKAKPAATSSCEISHEHWRELVSSGEVLKSTVPDLKRFLGANKKLVSGKKEVLLERVREVLGMQQQAHNP